MDDLVSTQWLTEHLGEADVVPVDCSVFMPGGRDAHSEFVASHIPGARFLDIDAVCDTANPAPHMLPGPGQFAEAMGQLGIGRSDRIVAYDNSPLRTAARGWFMFRHFGAERVAILNGGLQKWIADGRPVESGEPAPRRASFDASPRAGEVVSKQQLAQGVDAPVVDARSCNRFDGSEADPRPGVAPGHIPGARNLPFAALYHQDGTFKSPEEVRALFEEARVDPERPFVASCGSGVTANSLIFAARLLGNRDARLYDGSWSEWGADPSAPKATGSG